MRTKNRFLALAAGVAMLALPIGFSGNAQARGNGKSRKIPCGPAISICSRELIETTGDMNLVMTHKEDENGCMRYGFHLNTQNVAVAGLETGCTCRIIEVGNQHVYDVTLCEGCTAGIRYPSTWKVIAKGGGPHISHFNFHLTINVCRGGFIARHENWDSGCE